MATFQEPGLVYMNVTRDEAEGHLSNAMPGSYLIRPSSRTNGTYLSLSYLTSRGKMGHLLLTKEPTGWTTDGVDETFPTVRSLLKRLPYGLRLDDAQMRGGSGSAAAPAPAQGYGLVPSPAQMQQSAAYGHVPQMKAGPAGGVYGAGPPAVSAYNNATNVVSGNANYSAVPLLQESSYGRVPVGQTPANTSPYGRLQPTAPQNGTALQGYGRLPQAGGSSPSMPARPSRPPNAAAKAGYASATPPPGYTSASTSSNANPAQYRSLPRTGNNATPQAGYAAVSSVTPVPQGSPQVAPRYAGRKSHAQQSHGAQPPSVPQSGAINAPHHLAMQCLNLMQGNPPLAGHERFLRGQLALLAKAKDKAPSSTPIYTALVSLGGVLAGYHSQLRSLVQVPPAGLLDAILRNGTFQQYYISLQNLMRTLKSLLDDVGQSGGFTRAIHSELGSKFWAQHIGQNNHVPWSAFFQVLQAVLGMNMTKTESFVKFMFDCNSENRITAQSFNTFIHWFDFQGMRQPTTIKDFLIMLIARAEEVFFFKGFHGFVSREKAERILRGKPPHSYIIRLSDSSAGVFILSYVDSKQAIRHRLLNQVDKQGFMVEQKTYNTLPDLLKAHTKVLMHPVPNELTFEAPTESIYGGGGAMYESLSAAASPMRKTARGEYHAKIVLNRHWVAVTLELRESELSVVTVKSPLRTQISVSDVSECCVVQPRLDQVSNRADLSQFRIVAANQTYLFAVADPAAWVQAVNECVAEAQRQDSGRSSRQRSAEEKLVQNIVTRRFESADSLNDLKEAIFSAQRRAGVLSPIDLLFVQCVNDSLAKYHKKKGPKGTTAPSLSFSKLDLDMLLNGAKCETQIPVRDKLTVTNNGGAPAEVNVVGFSRQDASLKFVPDRFSVPAGGQVEVHVTLIFHTTCSLRELVHVSFGPGRGFGSLFLSIDIASKMMEALDFKKLDFGPRLGAGAFGQVFQGSFEGKEVAIKAVGFEPDFDQELAILRELRAHPNIVTYIGALKRKPFQGFIVLEFMQLGSLDKYVHDKNFQLELPYILRVSLDVAAGLAHLHKSRIMHLDIKPANVLINNLSLHAASCCKLADFGLSQSCDSDAAFKGEFVEGTLLYMAPEMLREKLFAFKGDIFSFGMTMWEMLMRQQPYSGPKHRKLNKPQFEEIRERGELPGELELINPIDVRNLIARMLALDYQSRPTGQECVKIIQKIRAQYM